MYFVRVFWLNVKHLFLRILNIPCVRLSDRRTPDILELEAGAGELPVVDLENREWWVDLHIAGHYS